MLVGGGLLFFGICERKKKGRKGKIKKVFTLENWEVVFSHFEI